MKHRQHNPEKKDRVTSARLVAKKSLGQNFLTSDIVPRWLCEAGDVTAGDTVLEIGPGTGALTRILLATGALVVAIETDKRAVTILKEEFATAIAAGQLQLWQTDARDLSPGALGLTDQEFKVVANIPYYLSGFLLRTLLEGAIQPTTLVFLMQKEVVARIARTPKESLLSLSVKAFGTPKYIKTVTRGHFNPIPKVDSAILQVSAISHAHFTNQTEQAIFFNLLHLGFGQKRKQLLSNLAHIYDRKTLTSLFNTLSLDLDVRAETVPLSTWLALLHRLKTLPTLSPVNA